MNSSRVSPLTSGRMANLTTTHQLAVYLRKHSDALAEFAEPLARQLAAIAGALEASEPVAFRDLRQAIRRVEQLTAKLEDERCKWARLKEQDKTEVAALNDKHSKALEARKAREAELREKHREQLAALRAEQAARVDALEKEYRAQLEALEAGAPARAAKKTAAGRKSRPAVEPDRVAAFDLRLRRFYEQVRTAGSGLERDGKSVVVRLRAASDEFAASQPAGPERLAARLSGIEQMGGLQSMKEGALWRQHGLSSFPTRHEALQVLAEASADDLRAIAAFLGLSTKRHRSLERMREALADDLTFRAQTR